MSFENIGIYMNQWVQSWLNPSTEQLTIILKTSLMVTMVVGAIALFRLLSDKKRSDIAFGRIELKETTLATQIKQLQHYRKIIFNMLLQRKQEHMTDTLFWTTLGIDVAVGIYLFLMKQPLMGLIAPLFFHQFFKMVFHAMTRQKSEDIEEQLPTTINNLIRAASKYDDLKSMFYDTSKKVENPMRGIMEQWAIKMATVPVEKLLLESAEEHNSIWFYSFTFIVIGYVGNSTKEDTMDNLRHLQEMLNREILLQKQQATERKYGVVINYAIACFAVVGFIANLVFNPIAQDFFYGSIGGIGCLLAGIGCIMTTIVVNLQLVKKSK